MPNLFAKLKKTHLYNDTIEYIYAQNIFDLKEYDKLYELQNYFNEKHWNNFKKEYNLKCKFFNDLKDIDINETIICLWFFVERADRIKNKDLEISCGNTKKLIAYSPNTFLIFYNDCKTNIKIIERKKYFPRRPCLQIYFNYETYNNICQHIKKN